MKIDFKFRTYLEASDSVFLSLLLKHPFQKVEALLI